jgi:para-nitrobenzyl esterase
LSASGAESWLPIVDGHVLEASLAKTMQSGKARKVPLIIGFTADEGTLLGTLIGAAPSLETNQKLLAGLNGESRAAQVIEHYSLDRFAGNAAAQLAALIGDGVMLCPGQRAARDHARAGNPVFAYQFTHLTSIGTGLGWGAFHGSDVPFVWGNPPSIGGAQITPTPDELTLIAAVQAYWTSFATMKQPAGVGLPEWPAYNPSAEARIDLDVPLSEKDGWPHAEDCAFWQSVLGSDL